MPVPALWWIAISQPHTCILAWQFPSCTPCSVAAMQRAACRSWHMLRMSCRSQNAGDAGKSWQGTPALEEPPTRRGSTEAPVPEYRASPTEASERDFGQHHQR